ncbi:phosphatidylserine decarboxylase [Candidatus Ruthia magnifica str. Cm (Calyptogena magnifica)]|uniref:Phosphatidylserine decarboxylase proenzyme n=1 Tax=Ruthia magnifica subsp. Calyptogena magnifica TaxID=413404 RepID=A1AW18_RUTMC|nr:archaetidylserine decarboxylase [Candidatus Ruthturnera calyptogenae]ABL02125.1 phosphatidylserine decarboxylase [Candidatus Ruthia magnifica str. Cm (Calyptogena magnifica)]
MIWWQYVIPQHWLSRLMLHFACIKNIWLKNRFIAWFVKSYQVNLSEAVRENIEDYQNFNDFFTRALKPDARKIADSLIVCPVDGKVSKVGNINNTQIIQAKNHKYSVEQLLGNDIRSVEFRVGFFITIYLSPKDYHRIHMPYYGKLISMSYIPGDLFSVNQTTAENVDGLFARNERVVCYFETEFGLCAFVLVGAIFVGSMQTVWHGQINPPYKKQIQHFDYSNEGISLKKGQELGRFNMGSTVIMLMPDQTNKFSLKETEVVRMGQALV